MIWLTPKFLEPREQVLKLMYHLYNASKMQIRLNSEVKSTKCFYVALFKHMASVFVERDLLTNAGSFLSNWLNIIPF